MRLRVGLGLFVVMAAGCAAPVQIPYDLARVQTRPAPRHPVRVAIVPFELVRDDREASDDRGEYTYNRRVYRGTRLEDLGRDPGARLTETIARHLAKARIFAQVILVLRPEQAPEADLVLSGKVRRARGYVEAAPPKKADGSPADSHLVLAEVVLEDLVITPLSGGPKRLEVDVGWSIAQPRSVGPGGAAPEPWQVMSDALAVALDDFVRVLDGAALDGSFEARSKVALALAPTATTALANPFGGLADGPPKGWAQAGTSSASAPAGWRGPARCQSLRLEARQTRRFSRALGPYTPGVDLWACPEDVALKFQGRADHPARLLGRRDGRWYFSLQVGRTNWRDAEAQIAAHLRLEPPPSRYIFEVGPGARGPVDKPRLRLRPRSPK